MPVFVVFLKFAANRAAAKTLMAGHNDWIAQGFAEGVFQCVGSLLPQAGGAILAQGESRAALEARLSADPFVARGVVTPEIHEIAVNRTTPALDFLKG